MIFPAATAVWRRFCDYPAAEIPSASPPRTWCTASKPAWWSRAISSNNSAACLDLRITYEQFCEIWSSIFLPDTLVPESMLAGIGARYRLLVLSNTNAIHFDMVRQNYPMLRHFHDLVLSYEVKAMKPSPAIYREAIARAQCRPEECFYTDDILAYVEGARREGIDAVQFESCAQLERDLAARDIRWYERHDHRLGADPPARRKEAALRTSASGVT